MLKLILTQSLSSIDSVHCAGPKEQKCNLLVLVLWNEGLGIALEQDSLRSLINTYTTASSC